MVVVVLLVVWDRWYNFRKFMIDDLKINLQSSAERSLDSSGARGVAKTGDNNFPVPVLAEQTALPKPSHRETPKGELVGSEMTHSEAREAPHVRQARGGENTLSGGVSPVSAGREGLATSNSKRDPGGALNQDSAPPAQNLQQERGFAHADNPIRLKYDEKRDWQESGSDSMESATADIRGTVLESSFNSRSEKLLDMDGQQEQKRIRRIQSEQDEPYSAQTLMGDNESKASPSGSGNVASMSQSTLRESQASDGRNTCGEYDSIPETRDNQKRKIKSGTGFIDSRAINPQLAALPNSQKVQGYGEEYLLYRQPKVVETYLAKGAACPQDAATPTLTTQEQKQPSLRPSPVSGVTPPVHTRWKKGCPSPNPGGRPKITREETAKWLEETDDEGKTNARKAIESVGEVAQSAGRHSAAALKTLHDILPDDKKDGESKGGVSIGNLNMAIIQQIQRAATEGELE